MLQRVSCGLPQSWRVRRRISCGASEKIYITGKEIHEKKQPLHATALLQLNVVVPAHSHLTPKNKNKLTSKMAQQDNGEPVNLSPQ